MDDAISQCYSYHITGNVAHRRISPLLASCAGDSGESGGGASNDLVWTDHQARSTKSAVRDSGERTTMADTATAAVTSLPSIAPVDFLWENAPRHDTKAWRDDVKCYSHLPNGTAILDSKWVLGRLLGSSAITTTSSTEETSNKLDESGATATVASEASLAVLETHCFRGCTGFTAFAAKVKLSSPSSDHHESKPNGNHHTEAVPFRDLMDDSATHAANPLALAVPNLWVVKDAHANGAGGIWVVGPDSDLASYESSILTEGHAYVAQRYAWPPVLYRRRKCHVRVYALLTADGCAYVHRRCFVHVANDTFGDSVAAATTAADQRPYPDSVHITNCCANSHDSEKFAGEICADLESVEHVRCPPDSDRDADLTVGLRAFAPSIHASVAALARRTFPFLRGGEANRGFEYLGLDFILSYRSSHEDHEAVAYLLEVNAPPSQDTATGLPHAENLHDTVIRDLLTLWVIPGVTGAKSQSGGWYGVYQDPRASRSTSTDQDMILPSKAAILNRIRWTLYERKRLSTDTKIADGAARVGNKFSVSQTNQTESTSIATFTRTFFPYFSSTKDRDYRGGESSGPNPIYLENAGGTQVPVLVVEALVSSISCRHRSVHGKASVVAAKATMSAILGAPPCAFTLYLGQNATTLLATLAYRYVETGLLKSGDEIVIASDNHLANVEPWLRAAHMVGAIVKWWDPDYLLSSQPATLDPTESIQFKNVLSGKTRIIAVPHASNVIGKLYDFSRLRAIVDEATQGYGHIVADGVAAVPHRFADLERLQLDWYVVSCHKLFGPHLGVLCGRLSTAERLSFHSEVASESSASVSSAIGASPGLETGTMNYEACEGVRGLGQYFAALSGYTPGSDNATECVDGDSTEANVLLDKHRAMEAYRLIGLAETPLMRLLMQGLTLSTKVHVIQGSDDTESQLPLVCFIHETVRCDAIVEHCRQGGITCRHGSFLSTQRLQAILHSNGGGNRTTAGDWQVVRLSLSHYNTAIEIHQVLTVLKSIPDWF